MGLNEDIIDGDGSDFTIIADGGMYKLSYSNSLDGNFIFHSLNEGTVNVDLYPKNIESIRYLRITYYSGDPILIDAIVALNHQTFGDSSPPFITSTENVNITKDIISVNINWITIEENPYIYKIYFNSTLFTEGFWEFGNIILDYVIPDPFVFVTISIEVFDIVGQSAGDEFIIQRTDLPVILPSVSEDKFSLSDAQFIFLSIAIISVFFFIQNKNKNKK